MECEKDTATGDCTAVEEERNTDNDTGAVEFRQPHCIRPELAKQSEESLKHCETNVSQPWKKRHSEPIPGRSSSDSGEGRNRFERRRIWSAHKQESVELPEDVKCPIEDNVFTEVQRSRPDRRLGLQRSLSVPLPATLPDVVPEHNFRCGDASPDVLFSMDKDSHNPSPVKSILLVTSDSEEMLELVEEQEKKKNFEGSVCYDSEDQPPEMKRKKSVTFDRMVSDKGQKARTRFRSSGYGSQSVSSQASQTSNISSEQGSVMSDDVIEEEKEKHEGKSSFDLAKFEACDMSCMDHHSLSSTRIDGSIDGVEEENCGGQTQVQASHATTSVQNVEEGSSVASPPEAACSHPNSTQTPEELVDETELWRRQHSPKFHCSGIDNEDDDLPNLSIFESEKESSSVYSGSAGIFSESDLSEHVLDEPAGAGYGDEAGRTRSDIPPPAQAAEQNAGTYGAQSGAGTAKADNSESKSSPTTKEECQRELFQRIFEERMVKFDNKSESLSDLLEWFKNNIGEALTPSPRSPFFPAGGSPQSHHYKVPEGALSFCCL